MCYNRGRIAARQGEREAPVIEVVIVDDHPPLRMGIKHALAEARDIRVAGEANNGVEMFSVLRQKPSTDVLLLDIQMPDFRVHDTVRELQARYPKLKVLIVSASDEGSRILKLIDAGVRGYILKDEPTKMYAHAIREIAAGGTYFSHHVAHVALTENGKDAIMLTPREHEVLSLAAAGLASPAIGMQLGISSKTVDTYAERACRKLGAPNRTTAVIRAIELSLVKVPARGGESNGQ
jgi:DNA-binding NarL/FixJ family response regulator